MDYLLIYRGRSIQFYVMIFRSLTNYPDIPNINYYLLFRDTDKYSSVRPSLIKKCSLRYKRNIWNINRKVK